MYINYLIYFDVFKVWPLMLIPGVNVNIFQLIQIVFFEYNIFSQKFEN